MFSLGIRIIRLGYIALVIAFVGVFIVESFNFVTIAYSKITEYLLGFGSALNGLSSGVSGCLGYYLKFLTLDTFFNMAISTFTVLLILWAGAKLFFLLFKFGLYFKTILLRV